MSVRAKFKVSHIGGDNDTKIINLQAVIGNSEENKSWSKWTPSGQIQMSITNPDAFNQFEQGKEFFVDFTEVPAS